MHHLRQPDTHENRRMDDTKPTSNSKDCVNVLNLAVSITARYKEQEKQQHVNNNI